MKSFLFSCAIALCVLSPTTMAASDDKDFNRFVEGALEVYSQFKKPSKEESERFYTFLQAKWNHADCDRTCGIEGYQAGKQYAREKNVEIKQPRGVQIIKTGL